MVKVADFGAVVHLIISSLWVFTLLSQMGQAKFCLQVCLVFFPGAHPFSPTDCLDMSEKA